MPPTVDELLGSLYSLPPWPPLETLATSLDLTLDALADLIIEAEDAGLVTPWEGDFTPGPTVLFSPLACERLGCRLAEVRTDARGNVFYAWVAVDWEPPAERYRGHKAESYEDAVGDSLISPDPGPLTMAIAAESAERFAAAARATKGYVPPQLFPRPKFLLGQTSRWDGPTPAGDRCPVCLGRELAALEFCLKCSRWGLDHLLPKVKPSPRRTPRTTNTKLKGGVGDRRRAG